MPAKVGPEPVIRRRRAAREQSDNEPEDQEQRQLRDKQPEGNPLTPGNIWCCGSVRWSVQPLTAAAPRWRCGRASKTQHHQPIGVSWSGPPLATVTLCRSDSGEAMTAIATARTATAKPEALSAAPRPGGWPGALPGGAAAASAAAAWMARWRRTEQRALPQPGLRQPQVPADGRTHCLSAPHIPGPLRGLSPTGPPPRRPPARRWRRASPGARYQLIHWAARRNGRRPARQRCSRSASRWR